MTAAKTGGSSVPPSDGLLSAKEAADYLGISLRRLYDFCRDGSLRHLRLADTAAGVLRFRRVWLDEWSLELPEKPMGKMLHHDQRGLPATVIAIEDPPTKQRDNHCRAKPYH